MTMRKRPKITEYRFDQWAEDLSDWIRESVSPFEKDTKKKQKARMERAGHDRLFFFQTYLPHYFFTDFAPFHEEWSDLADIKDQVVGVAAPREHAKSTFFTFGVPLHDIAFQGKHFILLISDTNDQATGFSLPIRLELETNPRLIHDFGQFRGRVWRKNDFVTAGGVRVLARGRGEKVRGLKNLQHRPDRAIVDDFENDLNVRNPKQVKTGKEWLLRAVLGSMGAGYSFVMVGNIFAPKSILAQLMAEKDEEGPLYISRTYQAILDEGKTDERPLWPEVWPMERLSAKRRQMGSLAFNAEFMNRVGAEESPIRPEWILYVDHPIPAPYQQEKMDRFISIQKLIRRSWRFISFLDPSAKGGTANDYKALITVALDQDKMVMDTAYAWIRHATVNEMIAACYENYREFNCPIGIEINMLEDFLLQVFDNAAIEQNLHLPLIKIRHTQEKIGRIISTLSPLIERGKLRFVKNHSDQDLLVEQLIYIMDQNVNDDGPDALEGAVRMVQSSTGLAPKILSAPRVPPLPQYGGGPVDWRAY